jgi:hypothetical protein
MFVVAPVSRKPLPDNPREYVASFPVVFEDVAEAYHLGPIAHRDTRDEAVKLAAALSKVLGMDGAALDKVLAMK